MNGSFWEMYKIFESPRDGHCILHSVLRYSNHCCADDDFTLSGIIEMLKSETIDNRDFYIAAIQDKPFDILYKELLLYVNYIIYKTDFGDMVPIILSNALKRDIFIIEGSLGNDRLYIYRHLVATTLTASGNHFFVYKCGEHYDACMPVKNDGDKKFSGNALNYEVKLSNDKSQYLKRDCKPDRTTNLALAGNLPTTQNNVATEGFLGVECLCTKALDNSFFRRIKGPLSYISIYSFIYGSNPSVGDQSYNNCCSVDNEVESHACNDHAHDLFPKVTDFRK